MDPIAFAIKRPVAVAVGVILVVMFGLIGVGAIPIQLTPTIDRPVITVTTSWPGRSPQEVVDSITREQEKRLKNISNLRTMISLSSEGRSEITLEFYLGSDVTRALQEVSDSLRQVPQYPDEVDQPVIKAAEGASEQAIAWIIYDLDPAAAARHPGFDISTLFDALDREVKPYMERIDGVAEVNLYGGREREMQVMVDPTALAQRGLNHGDVLRALRAENRNVSAGTSAEGKRDYRVRVVGQFESAEHILDTIVAYREARPVYLRDVATAEIGYNKPRGFVRSLGQPCMAMNVIRQSGANVMTVMADVRARLDEVRGEILPRLDPVVGPDLRVRQVYDETTYIQSAIRLVIRNLWIGGSLATIALLLYLRSFKSVAVVAMAIPISIIGTFLVMLASGRTLNVISLAGLAFATGMVMDNAIVVLENIDRRRGLGDPPLTAVYRGASQVWGAILASTLTTVAVFAPILTIQEEAGQLFFDLTLALAVSVVLSLTVAITVVPSATAVLSRLERPKNPRSPWRRVEAAFRSLFGLTYVFAAGVRRFGDVIYWLITGWRGWTLRPLLIVVMMGASLLLARWLAPPLDYLPAGNRNLVFGGILIPPGLAVDQMRQYAQGIEAHLRPYVEADINDPASVAALPPIRRFGAPGEFDPVPVDNFFIGAFGGSMFVGATSQDEQVVIPVGDLLTAAMNNIPDAFGGARQASIFGRGVAGGSSIDLQISGPNIARVTAVANYVFQQAGARYSFGNVRPDPANFNLSQPETRLVLNRFGRELGLRNEDLGVAVRALFDGAFSGDFVDQGRTIDIMVLPPGGRLDYKEQLANIPIATPSGRVVPVSSVADVIPAVAAQSIQRIEELPSITVRITPPVGRPVEEAMAEINADIIAPARASGLIDPTMRIRLEGTAAKLSEVRRSLFGRSDEAAPAVWWQRVLGVSAIIIAVAGLAVGVYALVRSVIAARSDFAYGAAGAMLLAAVVGGLFLGVATEPHLLQARFVWALVVTYLLMCTLFESFLYPFVIMFSVPLALVGGFAGLAIVHWYTVRDPTIAPQNLDILTMIGFVILVGTVVNGAILIVVQSLNFMRGTPATPEAPAEPPLPPMAAIAESVRTRVRPIFMTTTTTLGGGLPLVIAPGAGSEMYRGLGAVVLGGLLVSTVFTLILVPMAFSLVIQMRDGIQALWAGQRPGSAPPPRKESHQAQRPERRLQPV